MVCLCHLEKDVQDKKDLFRLKNNTFSLLLLPTLGSKCWKRHKLCQEPGHLVCVVHAGVRSTGGHDKNEWAPQFQLSLVQRFA